jgi:hypothetical protein
MYRKDHYRQLGLTDFNQPLGLKMNPDNRWIKEAETIPWDKIEKKYAELFSEYDRDAGKTFAYGTWITADPEETWLF